MIEFDENKNRTNIEKHGVTLAMAAEFDFEAAIVGVRKVNGEVRNVALSFIGRRLHVLVYVRRGEKLRVISLRKANKREVKYYDRYKKTH